MAAAPLSPFVTAGFWALAATVAPLAVGACDNGARSDASAASSGGAEASTGGARASSGGAETSTGGTRASTGGAEPSSGGSAEGGTAAGLGGLGGASQGGGRPEAGGSTLPELDYVPVEEPLSVPEGVALGPPADLEFDAQGHLWVLNRGARPVAEFDGEGSFVQAFGEDLFGARPHGLHLDPDGNIWIADGSTHIVVKLDPDGQVMQTLGTRGQAGNWDEAVGFQRFNEPNDVAVDESGSIFVIQGHTAARGDPRVFKFDQDGNFVATWGGLGTEPGRFDIGHGIAIDAEGLLWTMDRENQRIQLFDTEGSFVREMTYPGSPCGIDIGSEYVYLVNGFAGQLLRLDLAGNVLAALGQPGDGLGEFGEAHNVAVSPNGEIYVADVVNGMHKFVARGVSE